MSSCEAIEKLKTELNDVRHTLEQRNEELTTLKTLANSKDDELKSARDDTNTKTTKILELKNTIAKVEQENALHKQNSEHLEKNIEQQQKQNQKVERENQRLLDKQDSFFQMIQTSHLNQIKADGTDSLLCSTEPQHTNRKNNKPKESDNKTV